MKAAFLHFLEFIVVSFFDFEQHISLNKLLQMPKCSAYPGPLSVLVMDNAKIHHGDAILELADRFGNVLDI